MTRTQELHAAAHVLQLRLHDIARGCGETVLDPHLRLGAEYTVCHGTVQRLVQRDELALYSTPQHTSMTSRPAPSQ
jgi:hypothetical protein